MDPDSPTPFRLLTMAAATLLVSPSMFGYDTLILIVPLVWLAGRGRHRILLGACWGCCCSD